jgi:hypothetical protein
MKTELEKILEAIDYFKTKIEQQGYIINARDEEQLQRLLELREALTNN